MQSIACATRAPVPAPHDVPRVRAALLLVGASQGSRVAVRICLTHAHAHATTAPRCKHTSHLTPHARIYESHTALESLRDTQLHRYHADQVRPRPHMPPSALSLPSGIGGTGKVDAGQGEGRGEGANAVTECVRSPARRSSWTSRPITRYARSLPLADWLPFRTLAGFAARVVCFGAPMDGGMDGVR